MEKVEIFFLFFFPSGGNVLLPPATSQGTKQILTVRATESTRMDQPQKSGRTKNIVAYSSKHHFRDKKRVSHRSANMKLSNHGHLLAEVSLSMT